MFHLRLARGRARVRVKTQGVSRDAKNPPWLELRLGWRLGSEQNALRRPQANCHATNECARRRTPRCVWRSAALLLIGATIPIPWSADYSFDVRTFRRSLRGLLQLTPHIYIFGTAGEGYAVSDAQFEQITSVRIPPIHCHARCPPSAAAGFCFRDARC